MNYQMGESRLKHDFHVDSALVDLSTKKQAYASFSTVVTNSQIVPMPVMPLCVWLTSAI